MARTPGATRLREHLMASHTATEVGQLVLNQLVPADDTDFSEVDWMAEVL